MVSVPRWLHVGMSIKRWLVLLVVGITLLSLSAGYFLHALYSLDVRFPSWVGVLTLQFLGREVRGSLFLVSGAILTTLALLRLNRTVINALLPRDFRQCIAALADVEPLMGALLQYRFREGSGLEGHNLGNLLLAAMADITGNFELGLRELGRVLAVQGQILPSTLEDVVLAAQLRDKSTVHGESNMHQDHASGDVDLQGRAPIERVFLVPAHAVGYPEAVQALLDADIVVVGPGSLYTSVLPNLLVKDIARAVAASAAYKVFVCNVATEPGETDRYRAEDFLAAVSRHVGGNLFDAVITNTRLDAAHPPYWRSDVVVTDGHKTPGVEVISADVVDENNAVRHDAAKLARTILRAWARQGRTARRAHTQTEAREQARMA